jgi:IMP dehydrogenase
MKISKAYCFDDVLIKPKYSDISSRKEIDLSIQFDKKNTLKIPIISSPMDTVTEADMVCSLSALGGLGIVHRYNSINDQSQIVRRAKRSGAQNIGAAIGVGDDAIKRGRALIESGANVICIDIAHGHHALMRHTLVTFRNTFGYDIHIMAGNVATLKAFNDLADWGASSIRVGVGGGSICSTRIQTGHGVPTLQSVFDCAESDRDTILIADGGIRNSGDIVKCIAAGADAVMLGSLLAGTDEAPGVVKNVGGENIKTYRGMASKDAQLNWRGHYASVEGVTSFVKCQGSLENKIGDLLRGIRSGLSYSGCRNITEFQARAEFITQTPLGQVESGTHILSK